METFYDRRTDRTFITQTAHPVVASVVLAVAVAFVVLCVAMPFIETDPGGWLWLLEAMCIAFVIFLLRLSVQEFTEIAATFDAVSRTLTVSRTQPWGRTKQTCRYEEIIDVARRKSTLIAPDASGYIWNASLYSLEMTLVSGRRIRLRANTEAECDDAVRQVYRLIRA
jgi:hypothetical protein